MKKELNSAVVVVVILVAITGLGFVIYDAVNGGRTSSVDKPVMLNPLSANAGLPLKTPRGEDK